MKTKLGESLKSSLNLSMYLGLQTIFFHSKTVETLSLLVSDGWRGGGGRKRDFVLMVWTVLPWLVDVKQMLYFHIEMLNPWFSTTYIKSIEKPLDKAVVFWLHYICIELRVPTPDLTTFHLMWNFRLIISSAYLCPAFFSLTFHYRRLIKVLYILF